MQLQGSLRPGGETIGRDFNLEFHSRKWHLKYKAHTELARKSRDMGRVACLPREKRAEGSGQLQEQCS